MLIERGRPSFSGRGDHVAEADGARASRSPGFSAIAAFITAGPSSVASSRVPGEYGKPAGEWFCRPRDRLRERALVEPHGEGLPSIASGEQGSTGL
jgi:hypothetical protein